VRPGNTLSGIALLYHTSVDDVMTANGLSNPHHIYVGQSLTIPRR
jgi:LysM repeat protein